MTGLGLAACAGAFVLNLPWSSTWSWDDLVAPHAGRRARARPGRRGVDGDRAGPARGARPRPLRAGGHRARRRPGVAVHVGGPRRRAGRRVRRARRAPGPRRPARAGCPTSACCSCRSPSAWRSSAARRGRRRSATTSPARTFGWRQPVGAARARGGRRRRVPRRAHRSPTAPGSRPAPPLADVGRGAAAGRPDGRRLPGAVPRRSAAAARCPSTTSATASRWRSSTTGTLDLRDRWPAPDQDADDDARRRRSTRSAVVRRCAAAGCSPRSASATSSCRSSTAPTRPPTDPLPVPAGLLDALGDPARPRRCRYSPPNFVVFENRAAIPTTAVLDGELAEASRAESPDELVGVDTSGAEPALRRRRRRPAQRRPTPVAAGVAAPRRAARRRLASSSVGRCRRSPAARVRRDDRLRRRRGRVGRAALPVAGRAARRGSSCSAVLWVAALVAASRVRVPGAAGGAAGRRDETLIDLDTVAEPAGWPDRDRSTTRRPSHGGCGGWVDELARRRRGASRPRRRSAE